MNAPALLAEAHRRYRLRASDFEVLHESGALRDVRRAELIDGDIYSMSPQTAWHARAKSRLGFAIQERLVAIGHEGEAILEVSVIVADDSVPEPDIVVSTYKGSRFMPGDTVVLAVEVSRSTLDMDLGRKAALYAAASIPEYWVVDLEASRVVVHAQPEPEGYRAKSEVPFGDELVSVAIEGLRVPTAFLLD
jgi:Uma2 family endonuclease